MGARAEGGKRRRSRTDVVSHAVALVEYAAQIVIVLDLDTRRLSYSWQRRGGCWARRGGCWRRRVVIGAPASQCAVASREHIAEHTSRSEPIVIVVVDGGRRCSASQLCACDNTSQIHQIERQSAQRVSQSRRGLTSTRKGQSGAGFRRMFVAGPFGTQKHEQSEHVGLRQQARWLHLQHNNT
jgi:hypothetical protein